jgi:23S rRNA pseudouridine1911/1915/1917 synthase
MTGPFSIRVSIHQAGMRLDALLAQALDGCSRAHAAMLIRQGRVRVDGRACTKAAQRLSPGTSVSGVVPPPEPVAAVPEAIPLSVLHEDAHVIVIDKPPGLVIHPAPGHPAGTLVNALLHHCPDMGGIGGELRPGIVHRLDKDTSGVLVVAKNDMAMQDLGRQFKQRTVEKTYLGLVWGRPAADAGRIDLAIGRHPVERKQMSTRAPRARSAETHWLVRESLPAATLLTFVIKTGRTHQIRVHSAAMGHPILGDKVYGRPPASGALPPGLRDLPRAIPRQMLHAWRLAFDHPASGTRLQLEAPLPADMAALLAQLRAGLSSPER